MDAKTRKRTASVVVSGKPKYPINDKKHARLALELIHESKPPLSSGQEATVRRNAAKFGVKSGQPDTHHKGKK